MEFPSDPPVWTRDGVFITSTGNSFKLNLNSNTIIEIHTISNYGTNTYHITCHGYPFSDVIVWYYYSKCTLIFFLFAFICWTFSGAWIKVASG